MSGSRAGFEKGFLDSTNLGYGKSIIMVCVCVRLSQRPLLCVVCSLTTSRGDLMANHLAEQPEHRCLLLGGSGTAQAGVC